MTLQDHNTARRLQEDMDRQYATLFAKALPREDAETDYDAVHAFETWTALVHPQFEDAVQFLRRTIDSDYKDHKLARALAAESPIVRVLCGA